MKKYDKMQCANHFKNNYKKFEANVVEHVVLRGDRTQRTHGLQRVLTVFHCSHTAIVVSNPSRIAHIRPLSSLFIYWGHRKSFNDVHNESIKGSPSTLLTHVNQSETLANSEDDHEVLIVTFGWTKWLMGWGKGGERGGGGEIGQAMGLCPWPRCRHRQVFGPKSHTETLNFSRIFLLKSIL
jgi:hypothetical protein